MYLLRNLPFFKMVPPKTNFIFLFSNLGLIIAQQTNIHINCFMAGGWHTSCHPISKMHTVGEGPGETPSALRCLSYLINSFLTDIKQLAKTSKWGHSPSPFWCLCQKLSLSFFTLIKTLLHKALEWSSLVPGPDAKSSSEIMNLTPFTVSYHQSWSWKKKTWKGCEFNFCYNLASQKSIL